MSHERDLEILFERSQSLVCGVFGHADGPDGQPVVRIGGSGLFIAPFMVLSARHVTTDLLRTQPDRFDDLTRRRGEYFKPAHWSGLFQVVSGDARPAMWAVKRTWEEPLTDIALMEVVADQGASLLRQFQMPTGFPKWSLLPPPVGSRVVMVGFPRAAAAFIDPGVNFQGNYELQEGNVIEVFDNQRDAGMYSFPCFSITGAVDHGFSGGPVFWEDRLCGIVSGGSIGDVTYAASLWPLCLTEQESPDLGEVLGRKTGFTDLFNRGVLISPDWPAIRERISVRRNEHGKTHAAIEHPKPPHGGSPPQD